MSDVGGGGFSAIARSVMISAYDCLYDVPVFNAFQCYSS